MGRQGYPTEFRAEAVALYRASGRPLRDVAQDLGVSNESLRRWVQQADIDEGRRDGLTTEERREIRELRPERRRPGAVEAMLLSGNHDRKEAL